MISRADLGKIDRDRRAPNQKHWHYPANFEGAVPERVSHAFPLCAPVRAWNVDLTHIPLSVEAMDLRPANRSTRSRAPRPTRHQAGPTTTFPNGAKITARPVAKNQSRADARCLVERRATSRRSVTGPMIVTAMVMGDRGTGTRTMWHGTMDGPVPMGLGVPEAEEEVTDRHSHHPRLRPNRAGTVTPTGSTSSRSPSLHPGSSPYMRQQRRWWGTTTFGVPCSTTSSKSPIPIPCLCFLGFPHTSRTRVYPFCSYPSPGSISISLFMSVRC